jgi:hypothetical protein
MALLLVLNVGVAVLMILGKGRPAQSAKPIRAGSSLGVRGMAPAPDAPYNFRFMAISGGFMLLTAGGLYWFVRRKA